MKKKYLSILLLLFNLISCQSNNYSLNMNYNFLECTNLEDGNNQKAKVIVLLGQSNASGCSISEYLQLNTTKEKYEEYEKGYDNILINYCIDDHSFTSNGQFTKVDLNCGCGNGFFGPEVGMAELLSKSFPNEKLFILKYTMSGYSLNYHWLDNQKRGSIYKPCLKFIKQYMDSLITNNYDASIDAICWMQGESDTTIEKANKYYDNQVAFCNYLREDLKEYNKKEIYFIDAGISNSPYCEPGYPIINEAKYKFSLLSNYNKYFSTIDLGFTTTLEPDYNPDLGHYDSLCEIALGNEFAKEILNIYSSNKN